MNFSGIHDILVVEQQYPIAKWRIWDCHLIKQVIQIYAKNLFYCSESKFCLDLKCDWKSAGYASLIFVLNVVVLINLFYSC